jgi:hypothetical protein
MYMPSYTAETIHYYNLELRWSLPLNFSATMHFPTEFSRLWLHIDLDNKNVRWPYQAQVNSLLSKQKLKIDFCRKATKYMEL